MHRIPLRPLTFLVGENSSGKTTMLAALNGVMDGIGFPLSPGFNDPPYNLGTYDTIATSLGSGNRHADHFSLGYAIAEAAGQTDHEVLARYGSDSGNTLLRGFRGTGASGTIDLSIGDASIRISLTPHGLAAPAAELDAPFDAERLRSGIPLMLLVYDIVQRWTKDNGSHWTTESLRLADRMIAQMLAPGAQARSTAPIRSKPRRTYDEFSEEYSPEGDHVPTLLARLLDREESSPAGQRVLSALRAFGGESGLFRQVDVKRLGKQASDPFQLRVRVGGAAVNLTDVGYGVSQALPIVVQSVLHDEDATLLMQQPEVHLHPRAQAALGTFFARLVAGAKNRMAVIETHSDHLVDRVRREVAAGTIGADEVMILFFYRPRSETTVYPITLDPLGNVVDAPPAYRQFFLDETASLLHRTRG